MRILLSGLVSTVLLCSTSGPVAAQHSGSQVDWGLCPAVAAKLDPNNDGFFDDADKTGAISAARACVANGSDRGATSLVSAYRSNGDLPSARLALTDALKPGQDLAAANRSVCAIEGATNVTSARAACDRAIALRPGWAPPFFTRASVELGAKNYAEAIKAIDRALAIQPAQPAFQLLKARATNAAGKREESIGIARQAAAGAPLAAEPKEFLGQLLSESGKHAEAVEVLSGALAIRPSATGFGYRGASYSATERLDLAMADLRRAAELDPQWAFAQLQMALVHSDQKRPLDAMAAVEQAIVLDPKWARAYYTRGVYKAAAGQSDAAVLDYQQAVALFPDYSAAYSNIASIMLTKGRYEEAKVYGLKAIGASSPNENAFNNLANAYYNLGDKQKALATYSRALDLNPKLKPSLFWRARTRADLGDLTGGITDYKTLQEIDPNYGWAWVNRAELLLQSNRPKDAWADIDHILNGMRDNDRTWEIWTLSGLKAGIPIATMRATLDRVFPNTKEVGGKYVARAAINLNSSDSIARLNAMLIDARRAKQLSPRQGYTRGLASQIELIVAGYRAWEAKCKGVAFSYNLPDDTLRTCYPAQWQALIDDDDYYDY